MSEERDAGQPVQRAEEAARGPEDATAQATPPPVLPPLPKETPFSGAVAALLSPAVTTATCVRDVVAAQQALNAQLELLAAKLRTAAATAAPSPQQEQQINHNVTRMRQARQRVDAIGRHVGGLRGRLERVLAAVQQHRVRTDQRNSATKAQLEQTAAAIHEVEAEQAVAAQQQQQQQCREEEEAAGGIVAQTTPDVSKSAVAQDDEKERDEENAIPKEAEAEVQKEEEQPSEQPTTAPPPAGANDDESASNAADSAAASQLDEGASEEPPAAAGSTDAEGKGSEHEPTDENDGEE